MKTIMSYLIIVFSLFSFQLAKAETCETASPVNVSRLKFIGESLTSVLQSIGKGSTCHYVPNVNTDDEARKTCTAKNMAAVNPGNPQYVGKNAGHGTRGDNTLNYYFCMPLKKRSMCNYMATQKRDTLDIRWVSAGSGGENGGDCKCKKKGDSAAEEIECPSDTSAMEVATGCTAPGAQKQGGKCICPTTQQEPVNDKCDDPPAQVTDTVDDNDLEQCVAELKAAKEVCSDKGKSAIDKCSKDAPEINKNISEAQRVLSIGLDAIIAKNAGTGALESCAKMGAAGTSVIEALSFLRESCKKEINACKKGCEDVAALSKKDDKVYADECKAKFQAAGKQFTPAHETRLNELVAAQRDTAVNAEQFCKGNVEKADGQLDNFLQDLALSVQKADICKCQLSAGNLTGNQNCDAINNPLTCMQNINLPGCSFSSVGCSPGSQLPTCRSQTLPGNSNVSGLAAPPSGFAGPGFGSGGSGKAAGKLGINSGDLNGMFDETRPSGSGTATADAGSPFGVAAGGGGLGGGGGGGGGGGAEGGGDGAAGDEKDKSGLSGLFNSAKGGIASLFGGGADNKGSTTKKPDNKAYKNDVNGFRPKVGVRGMANANEVGTKNRDIWKTMNERYNDQYHTFITVESPSK